MLALQLHKAPAPNLHAGAYFIPIMRWHDRVWKEPDFETWKNPPDDGRGRGEWGYWSQFRGNEGVYRSWIKILQVPGGRAGFRNTKVHYISLVRVPDSHRVHMASDWSHRVCGLLDLPLRDIDASTKTQIGGEHTESELVLRERLPRSCLLWTKDWRLLRGGQRPRGMKGPAGSKGSRGGRCRGAWAEG